MIAKYTIPMAKIGTLYDTDFALWADQQADAIEHGRWADIDVDNVAEEIRALSRTDRRELRSRLKVMLAHILKQRYQPERASKSWTTSIDKQAEGIALVLEESPSLRRELDERMQKAYGDAVRSAARETGLARETFPPRLPEDLARQVHELLNE